MRLFIAVPLSEELRGDMELFMNTLRPLCEGAGFTARRNLHITLRFLGEAEGSAVPRIRDAMRRAALSHACFDAAAAGCGSFNGRNGEKTVFLAADAGTGLGALYGSLEDELASAGFPREARPLRAHITLARRAFCDGGALSRLEVPALCIPVRVITLFESSGSGGGLAYKPLFSAGLRDATSGGG
jgi:2'-5' RNA ligase